MLFKDYFPGTEERVCLVIGTIDNILSVYEFLSDRIRENLPSDLIRSRQIKLIIPNATAGVVIGKGGSTIESIKHTTNASLTIAPKCDMSERVMTITGRRIISLIFFSYLLCFKAKMKSDLRPWRLSWKKYKKILITTVNRMLIIRTRNIRQLMSLLIVRIC